MKKEMVGKRIKTLGKILTISALLVCIGLIDFSSSFAASTDGRKTFGYKKDTTYGEYMETYADAVKGQGEIIIPGTEYKKADMDVEVLENYEGSPGKSIKTEDDGYIEWDFDVPVEGLYNIGMKYFPIAGKNAPIEREMLIDGKVLFGEAKNLTFRRVWKDKELEVDNRGNELSPVQVENPIWLEVPFKDSYGYYNDPFEIYFTKGKHTIRLNSIKEPMVIEYLKVYREEAAPSYKEIKKTYTSNGYKAPQKDQYIKLQAEKSLYKSSQTDLPWNDRSSPAVEPSHPSKIRLNVMGNDGYMSMPGEWTSWKVEVPQDGLYKIAVKAKQSFMPGTFTTRKLFIDEKIPFKEAGNLQFNYRQDFEIKTIGDEKSGEPYLFYLTKGEHILRMESTIGDLAVLLKQAEESVYYLNDAYRKIIMRTSATPDIYRDYDLGKNLPEVINTFKEQAKIVRGIADYLFNATKTKGDNYAVLNRLAIQLEDMANKPDTIPSRLDNLNGNISALGNFIYNLRLQPVEIDYFLLTSEDQKLEKAEAGFGEKLIYEIRRFVASFVTDYNSVGNVAEESKKNVDVWVNAGRIQAEIIKRLADSTFSNKTGINVNIKLVNASLLQAFVAGEAPDVALTYGQPEPVNYATRNAVYNLASFDDFKEVAKRFKPSALEPFKLIKNDGVGFYALPERQTFPMLFYREDVLQDLGLKVPNTWEDVYSMLSVLHKNHMNFVVPYTDVMGGNTGSYGAGGITIQAGTGGSGAGMTTFGALLYQHEGKFYTDDNTACDLDSENAIQAFKQWIELYVNYHLPQRVDFANRFRTGEMPIGISDYIGLYNQLTVFAPELRGMWKMAPIPGTKQADGTVRRDAPGTSTGSMMLKSVKDPESAWEFMKWWTEEDTQYQFTLSMESAVGAAARQPMSNVAVHARMPWTKDEYNSIMEQWNWVKAIPEVPGGYYTTRHVDNAYRKVIQKGEDVRETMLDYVNIINDEIDKKRTEFGLKLRNESNK